MKVQMVLKVYYSDIGRKSNEKSNHKTSGLVIQGRINVSAGDGHDNASGDRVCFKVYTP